MSRTKLEVRERMAYGALEAVSAFVGGTASALAIDSLASGVELGVFGAALIGGGSAALKVIEEVAKDIKRHYRNKRRPNDNHTPYQPPEDNQ